MKYFTGIDVSLRSVSICVVDEAGAVRYEAKVAAEVDLIVASAAPLQRRDQAGRSRGRHPHAVPDLRLAEGRLRGDLPGGAPDGGDAGGHAQQDRSQRRARPGADPAHRLVPHRSRQEPREPPGAGAARQPQGDPDQVRRSGERAARPAQDLRRAAGVARRPRQLRRAVRAAVSAAAGAGHVPAAAARCAHGAVQDLPEARQRREGRGAPRIRSASG